MAGSFTARRKNAAITPRGPRGLIEPYPSQVDFKWPNARSGFISASNIFKVLGTFSATSAAYDYPEAQRQRPGASRSSLPTRRGEQLADSNSISCVFKALQPGEFWPSASPSASSAPAIRVAARPGATAPSLRGKRKRRPRGAMMAIEFARLLACELPRAIARYAPRRTPQVAETVGRPSRGARRRSTRVRATGASRRMDSRAGSAMGGFQERSRGNLSTICVFRKDNLAISKPLGRSS